MSAAATVYSPPPCTQPPRFPSRFSTADQKVVVGLSSTVSQDKEYKKGERAQRRLALRIGEEFRPYDLFHEVIVIPEALMSSTLISAGSKLCWAAISKRLGKSGGAYPSLRTLGLDLGVDRRQVFRWVAELEREKLLVSIERSAGPGDNDSNEYRLLWHPIFAGIELQGYGVDKLSTPATGVDKSSIPGADKSSTGGVDKSSSKKRNHHHQRNIEKRKEHGSGKLERKSVLSEESKTGGRRSSISFSDDDENPRRERLEDPVEELRQRFKERFRDESGAILQTVVADLGFDRQALAEFIAFDDAHTGAPARLKNPGGYYRALVKQFRDARIARIESEQRERYRAIERSLGPPKPEEEREERVCELGLCNGWGELCEAGVYRPCDCAAGQQLSPKVKELMEQMRRSVA